MMIFTKEYTQLTSKKHMQINLQKHTKEIILRDILDNIQKFGKQHILVNGKVYSQLTIQDSLQNNILRIM